MRLETDLRTRSGLISSALSVDLAATKPDILPSGGASMYEKILNRLSDLCRSCCVIAMLVRP